MRGLTTYRITSPDERDGRVVGVDFEDGVGFTSDPARVAFFERRGWEVEQVTELIGEPLTPEQEAALADALDQGIVQTVDPIDADAAQVALNTVQAVAEQAAADAKAAADAGDAGAAADAAAVAVVAAPDRAAADEALAAAAKAADDDAAAEKPAAASKPKAPAKAPAKK